MATAKDRKDAAHYLRITATHFAPRDWNYTRNNDIEHIRYKDAWKGRYNLWGRLKTTQHLLFSSRKTGLRKLLGGGAKWWQLKRRWSEVRAALVVGLRTDKHLPDGVLNNGNVIVHWEEDGEYLQVVQPSVGELVSNFLLEEPKNPHAIKISNEIDRILKSYSTRIKEGKDND